MIAIMVATCMHRQLDLRVRIQNISFATLTGFNTPVPPHTTIDELTYSSYNILVIQTVQLHHFHVLQLKSIKVQLGQLKARRLIQPEDIPVPIVSGDKEVCHFTAQDAGPFQG